MYVEIAFRKQLVIRFMRISDQCFWQQNNGAAIYTSISVQFQLRERERERERDVLMCLR